MRYVAQNRPFVIKNGARDWTARKTWNTSYLTTTMSSCDVNVALTPHGNADSVIQLSNGGSLFVKPHETTSPFPEVLAAIASQGHSTGTGTGPTRYAQTQNDNLRNEYTPLFADVPKSIPFAAIALRQDPDAINFWLGNSHSTTALHKDNYENVYVQILGQKHFTLLPPVCAPCVNERSILSATYNADMQVTIDDPETYTPFATWDPDTPTVNTTPYSSLARPLKVTLEEGDMLYLPALWYHKVGQSCDEEGLCCAVNYWYDLDFAGGFWSMSTFVRSVGLVGGREGGGDGEGDERRGKVMGGRKEGRKEGRDELTRDV